MLTDVNRLSIKQIQQEIVMKFAKRLNTCLAIASALLSLRTNAFHMSTHISVTHFLLFSGVSLLFYCITRRTSSRSNNVTLAGESNPGIHLGFRSAACSPLTARAPSQYRKHYVKGEHNEILLMHAKDG